MIKRQTWRGIALLAVASGLTWIAARDPEEVQGRSISELDTRLNYALHDFEGIMLDDTGRINLEMQSPVLRNDAETGVGTVISPEIRIQQEDDRWYISAETAIVSPDREHVSLVGAVNLTRRNLLDGALLKIATRDVMLNVTPRTASTDAAVRIEQGGDRLDAVGMNLDMISESVELLNDVRAHYDVP
jgi:LPS export ABC transporter protein LptC